jgi:hypothetical protein
MAVMERSPEVVTLDAFASRVGCHFTTVSRLKSGDRLPGRELLGRIIEAYSLDKEDALTAYIAGGESFSDFLRSCVFEQKE